MDKQAMQRMTPKSYTGMMGTNKLVLSKKVLFSDVQTYADIAPHRSWPGGICFPYRPLPRPRLVGRELSARA